MSVQSPYALNGIPVGAGAEDGSAWLCGEDDALVVGVGAVHPRAGVHLVNGAVVHGAGGADVVWRRRRKIRQ